MLIGSSVDETMTIRADESECTLKSASFRNINISFSVYNVSILKKKTSFYAMIDFRYSTSDTKE